MVGEPWTEEEKDILKEKWGNVHKEALVECLPNRSWMAIHRMASYMRITKRKFAFRKFWTEEEEKILGENWKDLPKEELMKLLSGRSWGTIKKKARSMGLPFRYNHPPKKARPFRPLTEFEKGYLCGVIDGEGSLSTSHDRKENRYIPHLTICNTNIQLLEKCNRLLSGYGFLSGWTMKNGKCSVLTVSRLNEIKIVLEAIADGLIAKKEAKLLLEFIKRYEGKLRVWGDDFEEIYSKMKHLNTGRRRNSIMSINSPNP